MNRTILTALDTIEENIRFIRTQLETDPSALHGVAGFHGAQEILREHSSRITNELPAVLHDKTVWFFHDLHNPGHDTAVAKIFFDTITEDGSWSKETDDIYLHLARLVKDAGLQGASMTFVDITPFEWMAFQGMYQIAISDLRKKTTEIPDLMVSITATHQIDPGNNEDLVLQHFISAYAYKGLLTDEVAVNQFFDEVYTKADATRLTDGTGIHNILVTCPELESYQKWAVRTGGFAKLMGERITRQEPKAEDPSDGPLAILAKNASAEPLATAVILREGTVIETIPCDSDDATVWANQVKDSFDYARSISQYQLELHFSHLTDALKAVLVECGFEIV